jgi:hypothetical protein
MDEPSIDAIIDAMPDGNAARLDTADDGHVLVSKVTMPELAALFGDPSLAVAYGLGFRPGVPRFQRTMELRHFPPLTPRNDLLIPLLWKWDGLVWSVTIIPAEPDGAGLIGRVAAECGLAAKRGAMPMMPGGRLGAASMPATDIHSFSVGMVRPDLPLDRAWYLENVPDHLIYRDRKAALAAEVKAIDRLEREYFGAGYKPGGPDEPPRWR